MEEQRRDKRAGQHWVHPDRRDLLSKSPALEETFASQPIHVTESYTQPKDQGDEPLFIRDDNSPVEQRQSSLERTLKAKAEAVVRRFQLVEAERKLKETTQAALPVKSSEIHAQERQSLLETPRTDGRPLSQHSEPPLSSLPSTTPTLHPPNVSEPRRQSFDLTRPSTMEKHPHLPLSSKSPPRSSHKHPLSSPDAAQPPVKKPKQLKKPAKFLRMMNNPRDNRVPPRPTTSSTASLTNLTNGEKDKFLNQMARYSAELLFPPTEQGVGGFACPPGLDLIRNSASKGENIGGQQGLMKTVETSIGGANRILGPGFGQVHGNLFFLLF